MPEYKPYYESKGISVARDRLTTPTKSYLIAEIAEASILRHQPKGKSGCFYGFGGFLLLIGGSIYEAELKAGVTLAIIGAVIMIIGMNLREPKPVFTLQLEMGSGQVIKAFTTRDEEVSEKAMKAITRAFKQLERDQAKQAAAGTEE